MDDNCTFNVPCSSFNKSQCCLTFNYNTVIQSQEQNYRNQEVVDCNTTTAHYYLYRRQSQKCTSTQVGLQKQRICGFATQGLYV